MPSNAIHLLLLAAGSGQRFAQGAKHLSVPKQYVSLAGRTVLEHSLAAFKDLAIRSAVITHSDDDMEINRLHLVAPYKITLAVGGASRAESVRLGLQTLHQAGADNSDWVLVHDAARCCVTEKDIQALIDMCLSKNRGGLLVSAIHDTLKFSQDGFQVDKTINREQMFAALTPQMFPLGDLLVALKEAEEQGMTVTDESSAMEAMGEQPLMIEGDAGNIKLTRVEQLPQVQAFLNQHNIKE